MKYIEIIISLSILSVIVYYFIFSYKKDKNVTKMILLIVAVITASLPIAFLLINRWMDKPVVTLGRPLNSEELWGFVIMKTGIILVVSIMTITSVWNMIADHKGVAFFYNFTRVLLSLLFLSCILVVLPITWSSLQYDWKLKNQLEVYESLQDSANLVQDAIQRHSQDSSYREIRRKEEKLKDSTDLYERMHREDPKPVVATKQKDTLKGSDEGEKVIVNKTPERINDERLRIRDSLQKARKN